MNIPFRSTILSMLVLGAVMPAAARQQEVPSADQVMTNWIMVDALDRKCRMLGLTDRVALGREIGAVSRMWRTTLPPSEPQAVLARLTQLTTAATEAAEAMSCDDAAGIVYQARREYFRSTLALIVSAAGNDRWDSEPDAIKASWQALVNEIGGFFGQEEFNRLRSEFQAAVETQTVDRSERWTQLRPLLFAAHWQLSLASEGYAIYPTRELDAQNTYVVINIETSEQLPFEISVPAEVSVTGEDGEQHKILSANGQSDDGRLVILMQEYDASAQPDELQASMLIQQAAQAGNAGSIRSFRASALPEDDCPSSFCFVFSQEATSASAPASGRTVQLMFTPPED